jgi:hypothetical protein
MRRTLDDAGAPMIGSRANSTAVKSGALGVTWTDAKTFEYARDGKRYR